MGTGSVGGSDRLKSVRGLELIRGTPKDHFLLLLLLLLFIIFLLLSLLLSIIGQIPVSLAPVTLIPAPLNLLQQWLNSHAINAHFLNIELKTRLSKITPEKTKMLIRANKIIPGN